MEKKNDPKAAEKAPEVVRVTQAGGRVRGRPVDRPDSRDIGVGHETGTGETVPASQPDDLKDE
jgi:hypothetical protein